MAQPSRRTLLTCLTAVTATGVAAAVPVAAIAATGAGVSARSAEGTLVAFVRDPATGEIKIRAGGNEITCYDKALAARLTQLAATART